MSTAGPLAGYRVIEFAGIGPGPFAGMLLADLGADVVLIERPAAQRSLGGGGALNRGKRSVCLDLKRPEARDAARALVLGADALIEGYRPGVMERLGLGPTDFEAAHPRLVYGRITGWGQSGTLAQTAGHDINYAALSGALSIASRRGVAPSLPATMLGDLGGGALFLVIGLLSALLEARRSGRGQVVDAAIVDGLSCLSALLLSLRGQGLWQDDPAQNFFLHESPFYDCFECADGRYLSLGAIEPAFYRELLLRLELGDEDPSRQYDTVDWPRLRARVAQRLRERTRDEWVSRFEGSDACVAPVLNLAEAAAHPHQRARSNHVEIDGQLQACAAPRFSRSAIRAPQAAPLPGHDGMALLLEAGLTPEQVQSLLGDDTASGH
ncbi:CaiB/BaiF CoA transferase family protein [Roseateles sp.]|jgi:alpha-methylacyl-CoA racemase|uniref:CaiB/BaiF CoA transferase family protein n=1 Tax=Roseateles sp. TaxID=1971397 RepID=UPI0039192E26